MRSKPLNKDKLGFHTPRWQSAVSPFVHPAVSLSVNLRACQSLCPSTRLLILCPSTRLPISLSVYPPASLFIRLPPVCLYSLCLSLSHCLHVYFSVSPESLNICPLLQRFVHCYRESICSESRCCFCFVVPHLLYAAFV